MTYIIILLNLFVLETLLSIDNAAVLAVMVRDLPKEQQPKALRYGLLGAFVFRGLCLLIASWLIKIMWLKIIGGLYLLWLFYKHFFTSESQDNTETIKRGFWATVLMVELMDIAFSMDNVFAAVAFTDNIYLIMAGVFIGIVSMRLVAQKFTVLMGRYPSLTKSAFIVIFFLGLKLVVSGILEYTSGRLKEVINGHAFDLVFSCMMMLIFFIPIIKTKMQSV